MSDDLIPYSPDLPAVPDHGGAVSIPDYSNVPALAPDAFTPDYNDDGRGGNYHDNAEGQSYFGTPISAPPEQVQQLVDGVVGTMFAELSKTDIDLGKLSASARWFQTEALKPIADEPVRHNYRVPAGFSQQDRAPLNRYLNFAARIGMSQRDVTAILTAYVALGQRMQAQAAKQPTAGRYGGTAVSDAAAYDAAVERSEDDAQACEAALRQKWGVEFVSRLRMVKRHVAGLPAQQREMLETSILDSGVAALNHPAVIERLWLESVGGQSHDVAGELAAIERLMRENRKAYNASEKTQARYRYLLSLRDGD